jgi:hypothetical protein
LVSQLQAEAPEHIPAPIDNDGIAAPCIYVPLHNGLYEENRPPLFLAIQAMILNADGKFAELV